MTWIRVTQRKRRTSLGQKSKQTKRVHPAARTKTSQGYSGGVPAPTLSSRQRMLLDFVQLLVNQHRDEHQQKYSGPDAENADRKYEPVDFD